MAIVAVKAWDASPLGCGMVAFGLTLLAFLIGALWLQKDQLREDLRGDRAQREEDGKKLALLVSLIASAKHALATRENSNRPGIAQDAQGKLATTVLVEAERLSHPDLFFTHDIAGLIRNPTTMPRQAGLVTEAHGTNSTDYTIAVIRAGAEEAARRFAKQRGLRLKL